MIATGSEKFNAVNYIGFIPILTAALQEQEKTIEQQSQEIQTLKDEIRALRKRSFQSPSQRLFYSGEIRAERLSLR